MNVRRRRQKPAETVHIIAVGIKCGRDSFPRPSGQRQSSTTRPQRVQRNMPLSPTIFAWQLAVGLALSRYEFRAKHEDRQYTPAIRHRTKKNHGHTAIVGTGKNYLHKNIYSAFLPKATEDGRRLPSYKQLSQQSRPGVRRQTFLTPRLVTATLTSLQRERQATIEQHGLHGTSTSTLSHIQYRAPHAVRTIRLESSRYSLLAAATLFSIKSSGRHSSTTKRQSLLRDH